MTGNVLRLSLVLVAACGRDFHLTDDGGVPDALGDAGVDTPPLVGPPVDPTVGTNAYTGSQFLYTGPDPVQTGVAPGTIEPARACVVRGRVIARDGTAIVGVDVTIVGHPELGATRTRGDGAFDLVVNGGAAIVVDLARDGFLPSQRRVVAPWLDYVRVPDVVLVALDPIVTAVDLTSASAQLARGSVQHDDYTRQATLVFPPGTQATMVLADGSQQSLAQLHVRATEYTVGASGPAAMPGSLPDASAYTYAVEFSVDEALAAGARGVTFSQPVVAYVDDFLHFKVGAGVPSGFYDRTSAAWVGGPDGRVVQIVGVTNGAADLDITGDGVADDASPLGVTDAERAQLAAAYPIGATLWRVPIAHFSPWDFNWGYGPPNGAFGPHGLFRWARNASDPCNSTGSIVHCDSRVLGEKLPVAGTPLHLVYGSDRVPQHAASYATYVPLSDATPPASLKRIDVTLSVAGRQVVQSFPPEANQATTMAWDGIDAYGRVMQGEQAATFTVGYVFDGVYLQPGTQDAAEAIHSTFGHFTYDGFPASGDRAREEVSLNQIVRTTLGGFTARGLGLGGWTLDVHHVYMPATNKLYLGDGRHRDADRQRGGLVTAAFARVAGAGFPAGYGGDGGPARLARIQGGDLALGADDTLYIADTFNFRVRKVDRSGVITTIAGTGTRGSTGDGGPATQAQLVPGSVAVAPDGSVYVTDGGRIRKIAPDGTIATIAGGAVAGFAGDDGPALAAQLRPDHIAVAPDGTIYVAEGQNARVRRITPDGIISTICGTGVENLSGSGGPALQASLAYPRQLAIGPDGSIFIADSIDDAILRIGTDGKLETIADNLGQVSSVAVARDGTVYFGSNAIYRLDGTTPYPLTKLGTGVPSDGAPAGASFAPTTPLLAFGPDDQLYASGPGQAAVYVVRPPLRDFGEPSYLIPSEDGDEVYVFDAGGRHLRTVDALTGTARYTFGYDAAGQLATLTDADGNVTTIRRDGDGNPTAIVAPYGQTTTLATNGDGYLTSVADPAGGTVQLAYASAGSGQLASFTDARGNVHTFTYDPADGRLVRDADPIGGATTLASTFTDTSEIVTKTTALGLVTTYTTTNDPGGNVHRTIVGPTGATLDTVYGFDGSQTVTYPDGSRSVLHVAGDPRFGVLAPTLASFTLALAGGGPTSTLTLARAVTLAHPDDPLSLVALTDTVTLNGATSVHAYDATARTITHTSPAGRRTVLALDAADRVTTAQLDPALAPLATSYDAAGRLAAETAGVESTTFAYDGLGRPSTISDALAHATGFTYDGADRLATLTSPAGRAFAFAWDRSGNPTQATSPDGASHALAYTALDELASFTPAGSPAAYRRSYDVDGNVVASTLPSGRAEAFTYDAGGRLASLAFPEATVAFAYGDATARAASITRTPASGAAETLAYTYAGELVTSIAATGPLAATVTYAYDASLRVRAIALAGGPSVSIARDADGLVTSYGSLAIAHAGPAGALSSIGDGALAASFGYDAIGRANSRAWTVSAQPIYDEELVYDAAGHVARRTETIAGATTTLDYTYDADGAIVAVARDGAASEAYAYDVAGNRTTPGASYDAQGRLAARGAIAYAFSADGFLAQRGADTFAYTTRGELASATIGGQTVTYAYDGFGRRVARTVAGATTQYLYTNPDDALQITHEIDPSGTITWLYYDDRGRLVAFDRGAARFYVATDHVGTPRAIADATGAIVRTLEVDAFGVPIADSAPAFDLPIGYAGGLADPLTGLVRFGFRDYEPASGRWTARDPLLLGGHQVNLYEYAGNDPIGARDPSGLLSIEANFYAEIGGGVRIGITTKGISITFEEGIGAGAGFSVDPNGGLRPGGLSAVAQARAAFGPLQGTLGLRFHDCGSFIAVVPLTRGRLGPIEVNESGSASWRWKGDEDRVRDLFKGKAELGVKAAFEQTIAITW